MEHSLWGDLRIDGKSTCESEYIVVKLDLRAEYAAAADVTASPITVGGRVDAHAAGSAGVDELECAVLVHIGNDAYVTDVLAAMTEEHEIARQQILLTGDGLTLSDLLTRGTLKGDTKALEHIACEARAVESRRAAGTTAVAGAYVTLSSLDEVGGKRECLWHG